MGVPCFSLASPRTFLSLLTGIPTEDSFTGSHIRSDRARVLYVSRREAVRQCDRVLLHLYGSLPSPQNAALIGLICTGRGQRGRLRLLLRNSTTYEEVRLPLSFPPSYPLTFVPSGRSEPLHWTTTCTTPTGNDPLRTPTTTRHSSSASSVPSSPSATPTTSKASAPYSK